MTMQLLFLVIFLLLFIIIICLFNGNIIALYCSLAFWEVKKLALLVKSLVGID
jgi:hypothetical protein